jgi:hypothetical protein
MKHTNPIRLSQKTASERWFWDILGINLGYKTIGKYETRILHSLKVFNVGIIIDLFDQFQNRHAGTHYIYPTPTLEK